MPDPSGRKQSLPDQIRETSAENVQVQRELIAEVEATNDVLREALGEPGREQTRRFVDLIEIDMQRVAGWPDFHPEDYCHRCGGRNVYSWHAPDEVWNRLRGDGLLPASEIVCPQCFTDLARQIGVEPSVWHLSAEAPHA